MPSPSSSNPDRLNAAVRAILEDCIKARDPLDVLSQHIARLDEDPSWDQKGVATIEIVTLRMLSEMVRRFPGS